MRYLPVLKNMFAPFLILCIGLMGCREQEQKQQNEFAFEFVDPSVSGIHFKNVVQDTQDFNIFLYRNFYNGAGVGIGDINNDDLPDIYFTSNMGDNKLFLNKGNFKFEDITKSAGVTCSKKWSTGVTFVDINADGLLDIYVSVAGYQKGVDQRNELFINNGDLTFTERAKEYNLDENGYTTQTSFFDYDKDGDLDAYVLNNSFMPVNTLNYSNKRELPASEWPVKDFLKGGGDRLMRNDNGVFKDVSTESGIYNSLIGFGLGVTVGDVDNDGWEDIYVSNDFFERDYLYINLRNGKFKESVTERMSHLSSFSMGSDMGDINNDGFQEIFVTDMLPDDEYRLKTNSSFEDYNTYEIKLNRDFYHQYMQNTLQLNNGDGSFSEIARYSGVAASDWSWGALLADVNNDGYKDIYVSNGIYHDVTNQDFIDFFANETIMRMAFSGKKMEVESIVNKMPSTPIANKLFINDGNLKFKDVSSHPSNKPSFSNGAAYGDLDNDGDLDLVVSNVNQECFVLRNKTSDSKAGHYLKIKLRGSGKNTFEIGAIVRAYIGGTQQVAQVMPARGFQSSVEYTLLFGLGKATKVDSISVQWSDMSMSTFSNFASDTTYIFSKPKDNTNFYKPREEPETGVFRTADIELEKHKEDKFVDFYGERLIINMLSREGPKAAVGDVNADGRDDVFVCGALDQPAQLYFQVESGFTKSNQPDFVRDAAFEDTACLFFDADQDGDLDLFVGSGGNHSHTGARLMQDRVYFNNGTGKFTLFTNALPNNGFNTAVVVPVDYDKDGDVDLFVGSRSVPSNYGVKPKHFLYRNDGTGKFANVIDEVAPELSGYGMITDVILSDQTGDKTPELVVVGDWGSPKIFSFDNTGFASVKNNLDSWSGWWSAVYSADTDGDGDQDLILGNRGENFYFTATPDRPAKLWLFDFDLNGALDVIPTFTNDGRDMPLHGKKDLTLQINILKKQNLKHSEYARKSIQELFPADVLKKAMVLEIAHSESIIAINDGDGNYTPQALPAEAQLSCVNAIRSVEINNDGKPDLILAGNDLAFRPQFSKLDASYGTTLLNKGDNRFDVIPVLQSGFSIKGDVRQIASVKVNGIDHLLCLVNNGVPQFFRLNGDGK